MAAQSAAIIMNIGVRRSRAPIFMKYAFDSTFAK
jgi:hypothetical protein